jgi:CheY-like chemotaxis protein
MAEIVVADDDPDMRAVIERILRRAGHTVTLCDDGAALVAEARARRPDVVVTDNHMPRMTGLQARETLRSDPDTARIPMIVHSGFSIAAEAAHVLGDGDQFLPKPFTPSDLLEAVESALRYAAAVD